jgi:hypothetical protein
MKLIKLTMVHGQGWLKTKWIETEIYVNPNNIDYIWDWTQNDTAEAQTVLHINAKRIYVKENFSEVLKMLKEGGK